MKAADARNLAPHRAAVAAMWLFGADYADQRGGSMDFWDSLNEAQKYNCRRLVSDIEAAPPERATTASSTASEGPKHD